MFPHVIWIWWGWAPPYDSGNDRCMERTLSLSVFEIGIAAQTFLEFLEIGLAGVGIEVFRLGDFLAVGAEQVFGIEVHIAQHRADGVAAPRLGELVAAVAGRLDVHRVGVGGQGG